MENDTNEASPNSTRTPVSTEKIDMDLHGDIILILEQVELRVSSKVLSLASPVFKALCTPGFAEGNTIAMGGVSCIHLPEDDTDAMIAFCSVTHFRPYSNDAPITLLENLAIITDKYDCVSSMRSFGGLSLSDSIRKASGTLNDGRLLYSAYVFDNAYAFQQVTVLIVYSLSGAQQASYGISAEIRALLPEGVLETLVVEERGVRKTLFAGLEAILSPLLQKPLNRERAFRGLTGTSAESYDLEIFCECDCSRIGLYLRELSIRKIWPFTECSDQHTLSDITKMLESCLFQSSDPKSFGCETCSIDFNERVGILRVQVLNAFKGLCLDCFKAGRPGGVKADRCRIPHDDDQGREEV